ncbi:hypothetical protein BH10PSE12_BH10PSE12_23090 [soil metagenome]
MLEYTKSEAKDWARKNYRGLESCIYPSFTPDLKELDEDAIRYDVNFEAKNGFFSILLCAGAGGLTFEEKLRFAEIVNDEAKGKILSSLYIEGDTIEDQLLLLDHHEKTGGNHALLGFPQNYYAATAEDAYQAIAKMANHTNLAVDIYPTTKFNLGRFHPGSGFPPEFMERLADLPNVAGMKIGHGPVFIPGYSEECYRRCGDKILVNQPIFDWWPVSTKMYDAKWSGGCPWHAFQTPDNPRAVKCFDLFLEGKEDEAFELFWQIAPVWQALTRDVMTYGMGGIYNYQLWKYTQWLTGGNGGLLRMPMHRLYDHDALAIKTAMQMCGIEVRDAPMEEYYIGRLNWEKGHRIKV